MTNEMVSVRIRGRVSLHLNETVRMSREKFERLNALWESEDGMGVDDAELFLDHLNLTEPASVDYEDVDDFEIVES